MLVLDRPGFHRNDGFWRRWAVAQSTMRLFSVVVFSPFFDQDLCLFQRVEDLAVQKFITLPFALIALLIWNDPSHTTTGVFNISISTGDQMHVDMEDRLTC